MKVSLEILQRVYQTLQESGERSTAERDIIDPESHLYFVDAFEMPRWHWSHERGAFERYLIFVFSQCGCRLRRPEQLRL